MGQAIQVMFVALLISAIVSLLVALLIQILGKCVHGGSDVAESVQRPANNSDAELALSLALAFRNRCKR